MGSLRSLRVGLGQLAGPVLGVCSVIYFGFHVVNGDRGLLTYLQLKQHIIETSPVLEDIRFQREKLDHQVSLLRPDNLDLDMLEERARVMLSYGYVDDVVVLYEGEPEP